MKQTAILILAVLLNLGLAAQDQNGLTPLTSVKGDAASIEAKSLPDAVSFTAQPINVNGEAAIFDLNGDNLDDIVGATTTNIHVHYQQPDGSLIEDNISTPNADFSPSWSMAAGDLNNDGYADFVYGAGSGVSIMTSTSDGTAYTEHSGPEYVFSQRTNMVDINNDGELDVFVCHDVDPNVFYLNDGNGNMTFFQGGLGNTPQGGNYGSVWIDYDNDHDIDLFIAKCGADPWNQLHRNDGNGSFTDVTAETGLTSNVQTWSSAWGDYDNDGDMDLFVGASSTGNGGHQLMRNDGGVFTDVTAGSGLLNSIGTSIENCTQDFNNDGYLDILGLGGAMMLNNGDMTFTETPVSATNGAIGDVNSDGFLDILTWNDLHINDGNLNNYLRVHLQGVESNRDGIGARVEITSAMGTQIRDIRSGEGFSYMSSLTAHYGIAQDTEIEQVVVHWPSGTMDVIHNPSINSLLEIVEGSTSVGVNEFAKEEWSLYPTPTQDFINIRSTADLSGASYVVIDVLGQAVLTGADLVNQIDISSLSSGNYVVRVIKGNLSHEMNFNKL